jgi:hypothetical protein
MGWDAPDAETQIRSANLQRGMSREILLAAAEQAYKKGGSEDSPLEAERKKKKLMDQLENEYMEKGGLRAVGEYFSGRFTLPKKSGPSFADILKMHTEKPWFKGGK